MASLTFRLQQRFFDGDLPDASQSGTVLVFQPSFPFPLDNGDVIFFRPGIPFQLSAPSPDPGGIGFSSESGIGDIAFDVAYGRTTKTGGLYAGGMIVSLPTATEWPSTRPAIPRPGISRASVTARTTRTVCEWERRNACATG